MRGIQVSHQIIWNCARRLCARRAVGVPDHTTRHRRHHLAWAREHLHWKRDQWALVLFSDEGQFTLSRNDGCQRCWRHQGESYPSATVVTRRVFADGGVTVWAGVSSPGVPNLFCAKDRQKHKKNFTDRLAIYVNFKIHWRQNNAFQNAISFFYSAKCTMVSYINLLRSI